MYATRNANQYEGDIVIQEGTTTYVGRLMPGYPRTGAEVRKLPVWQIQRCTQTNIPANNENDPDTIITECMYPNGNEDYVFVMDDYKTLTYDFRH